MNRPLPSPGRRKPRGFTLIEALIALVVIAGGALAVAGFQLHMSRASDVAKQRSEAVRLAQQKLEELRSFDSTRPPPTGSTVFPGTYNYQDRVVSGSDAPTDPATTVSNTAFTRSWVVTRDGVAAAAPNEPQKWVAVTVTWTDRTGEAQSVVLRSAISSSDPIDIGILATGPGQTKTRQPKGRSLDIPYPAVDIGGNKSAFTPPGSGDRFYVFDNDTGVVSARCDFSLPSDPMGVDLSTCFNYVVQPYLLSGYVRFDNGGGGSGTTKLVNSNDDTLDLDARIVFVGVGSGGLKGDAICFAQRRKIRRGEYTSVVDTGATDSLSVSRFVAYTCIVTGVDHDGNDATPPVWSGQFVISPGSGWTLGSSGGSAYRFCRYSGDYKKDDRIANAEHPLYYRLVSGTLDNQNYIAIKGSDCPTAAEPDPIEAKSDEAYLNLNTVIHQTRAHGGATSPASDHFGGAFSTTASQWSASGAEPSSTSAAIPMY
ncbi:MAG: prepilin-type N-terminal cleavage/methylation domain-containing protein [Rubrivivax sp.]|nr:prepilin-type N-terminal cleavage/methylation domain-containing protein [Rubrivivax sp.]